MRHVVRIVVWSLAILVVTAFGAAADTPAYIGAKKCKKCHFKQHKSWAATTMANVFDVLRPGERADAKKKAGLDPAKDYTTDPVCLACHTTGYGKEGGFVDEATTPDLVGVGCEMCHGPGGTYVADEHMSMKNKEYSLADLTPLGLVSPPTKEQCLNCHNTDSPFVGDDYVFDFEKRKTEGTHDHVPLKYKH